MTPDKRHDCESIRFALLRRAEGDPSQDPRAVASEPADRVELLSVSTRELDAHLATCADCRRELVRAAHRVGLVRSLARRPAPSELDGLVVAALQAGVRQERAIEAVAGLTPVAAPTDLARRLAVPRAPAVLDRLVGEDLADPAKAVASRYTRRLERLRAPEDLEHRVGRSTARRPRALPLVLTAAGLLLMIGALGIAHFLRDRVVDRPEPVAVPVLVVERVDSVRDLDPVVQNLLAGVTGGLVDSERLKQEEL